MKKLHLLFFTALLTISSNAQITIGSGDKPAEGVLLDLKMTEEVANSTKGLGLPRVMLSDIKTQTDLGMTMGATEPNTLNAEEHIGLVVYNVGKNEQNEAERFCPGIHVWNGTHWLPFNPYPEIYVSRTYVSRVNRGFRYLDPSSEAGDWPAGTTNANFPLGHIGTFTDNRLNDDAQTYNYTRFYVGYKTWDATYEVTKSFSCDVNNRVYENSTEVVTEEVFDDGVWMAESLRALKGNDGSALASFINTDVNDISVSKYMYPNQSSANKQHGVLYNWRAAMGIGTSTGAADYPGKIDQGGSTNPDVVVQGICPDGWFLPADQEWTDLANGIVFKSGENIFSSALAGAATTVGYDVDHSPTSTSGTGGYLGQAIKTTTSIAYTTYGRSKTKSTGGFDAYLTGSGSEVMPNVPGPYDYGLAAYFWSASRTALTTREGAYYRWFRSNSSNYFRTYHGANQTFAVRCKKTINP